MKNCCLFNACSSFGILRGLMQVVLFFHLVHVICLNEHSGAHTDYGKVFSLSMNNLLGLGGNLITVLLNRSVDVG